MVRVLVVADVPWVVNEVRAGLGTADYELVEVADPRTAVAAAREHDVDVVVADLQVGSMGGMAVTHDVRSGFATAGAESPPVVMLLDRAADGFLAKRAGADGWLAKPFTARQLRDTLARALERPAPPPDDPVGMDDLAPPEDVPDSAEAAVEGAGPG